MSDFPTGGEYQIDASKVGALKDRIKALQEDNTATIEEKKQLEAARQELLLKKNLSETDVKVISEKVDALIEKRKSLTGDKKEASRESLDQAVKLENVFKNRAR